MGADGLKMSSPFSTGGGGVNFETEVQACFVTFMLAGGFAPCLPCQPIHRIKLQGLYDGYLTDDFIAFTANNDGSDKRKLLAQIKHTIAITEKDKEFKKVIKSAWRDFNNPAIFTRKKDAFALITGPLSATAISDVRTLLEWARSSGDEHEFLTKVATAKFSSNSKRAKLNAFRKNIDAASEETVSDKDFFEFLRHFHLLGYDLDIRSGAMHSILHTIIGNASRDNAASLWKKIVYEVRYANQNAGTICVENLPKDLVDAFSERIVVRMPERLSQSSNPCETRDWNDSKFASALVTANLLGAWDESSEADIAIIKKLIGGEFNAWQSQIREVLQLPDSPLTLRNHIWTVKQRHELWQALGSRVFDSHLDLFEDCALTILNERDPRFELTSKQRYSAPIYGKICKHSSFLRNGIAETLAILGNRPKALKNSSRTKTKQVIWSIIPGVLNDADWILWGSLNELLPLLAEAAPNEFLGAVENALNRIPSPFEELFAQEEGGVTGRNYLTGLLWALERLAWDEELLVRTVVVIGMLAKHDPGGRWANRPANSLTTIFLPWYPQTMASDKKKIVAVKTLREELPEVAWELLLSLLPSQVATSSPISKPVWRKLIPDGWNEDITNEQYRNRTSEYSHLLVEMALVDASKLARLISHLSQLPPASLDTILAYLSSEKILNIEEKKRLEVWNSLIELILKHRRHASAKWAFPETTISRLEESAKRFAPSDPLDLNKRLFSENTWDLHEKTGDWEGEERKLEQRRQDALQEMFKLGGLDIIIQFAQSVEVPHQVGLSFGFIADKETESFILPNMLESSSTSEARFAAGFVLGRYRFKDWSWVDEVIKNTWTNEKIGRLLAALPFTSDAWERSDSYLGKDACKYWSIAYVNPCLANGNLNIAIDKLIEYGRPRAAIYCLAHMLYENQPIDNGLAVKALLQAVNSTERLDTHHVVEVITAIQKAPETEESDIYKVEWAYLPILSRNDSISPKLLENRLAIDPQFFCEVIRTIYRANAKSEFVGATTEQQKILAENAYRLLSKWTIPPGTIPTGGFSGKDFTNWVESVTRATKESGHLEVAHNHISKVLIYCPPDPSGFWINSDVARFLNRKDVEEVRRSYVIATYNSRGAHHVDPTGKPEKELAKRYERRATDTENMGFHRFAATLRGLAKSYEQDAERIIAEYGTEEQE